MAQALSAEELARLASGVAERVLAQLSPQVATDSIASFLPYDCGGNGFDCTVNYQCQKSHSCSGTFNCNGKFRLPDQKLTDL